MGGRAGWCSPLLRPVVTAACLGAPPPPPPQVEDLFRDHPQIRSVWTPDANYRRAPQAPRQGAGRGVLKPAVPVGQAPREGLCRVDGSWRCLPDGQRKRVPHTHTHPPPLPPHTHTTLPAPRGPALAPPPTLQAHAFSVQRRLGVDTGGRPAAAAPAERRRPGRRGAGARGGAGRHPPLRAGGKAEAACSRAVVLGTLLMRGRVRQEGMAASFGCRLDAGAAPTTSSSARVAATGRVCSACPALGVEPIADSCGTPEA